MSSFLTPAVHIKGLIFDLDGTLADTMPLHMKAWKATADYWEVNITEKMINDRLGIPTIQIIEELNQLFDWALDPFEFRKKKNEFYGGMKIEQGKIQAIPQVAEIVYRYKGVLAMSVGTGSIPKNAMTAISDMGMTDYFAAIVTADDVKKHKPDPETFLKCADAMNLPPAECLVYEDSPLGVQAALDGGMSAINILTEEVFYQ